MNITHSDEFTKTLAHLNTATLIALAVEECLTHKHDTRPRLRMKANKSLPLDHPENWEAGRVYTQDDLAHARAMQRENDLIEDARAFGYYGPIR